MARGSRWIRPAQWRRRSTAGFSACPRPRSSSKIDLAARVVRREGGEVHLTPIEFKLLRVLTQNRGLMLTHNALLQQVWGAAYRAQDVRRPAEEVIDRDLVRICGIRPTDSRPAAWARPAGRGVLDTPYGRVA